MYPYGYIFSDIGSMRGRSGTGRGTRRGGLRAVLLLALIASGAGVSGAQAPPSPPVAEDCDGAAWPLAAERAALAALPAQAATSGARMALPVAGAIALTLAPAASAGLPHPPGRPPPPGTTAGFLTLDVPEPGRVWQITLSAAGWVDVFANGRALDPVAFTGLHACPGVRKSLRFSLPPGPAVLQISGAGTAGLGLVVVPAP